MLDLGLKIVKNKEDNNYKIEDVDLIRIDEESMTAELINSEEKEVYPLINIGYDEDVFIIPSQEKLLDNIEEDITIDKKIDLLKEKLNGTELVMDLKEVEDQVIDIDNLDVRKLSEEVKETIVGQDDAVEKVISVIVNNQKLYDSDDEDDEVRNARELMLIYGKTGTGKTEMIKQIAKRINIPYVIEDATKFTQEGYKDRSTSDMLLDLLRQTDGDIELAERGILVIDEIDKKRAVGSETVSSKAVQESLLKIMDGGVMQVVIDPLTEETVDFDTSFLTVILLGAFEGIQKSNATRQIGFNSDLKLVSRDNKKSKTDDFIKYGMTPEFMGRISHVVKTNDLGYEGLRKILLTSKLSPLKLKKKKLDRLNIKCNINEELIDTIVKMALEKNTGARGLKSAVFDIFDSDEFNLDFAALAGDVKEIDFKKGKVRAIGAREK